MSLQDRKYYNGVEMAWTEAGRIRSDVSDTDTRRNIDFRILTFTCTSISAKVSEELSSVSTNFTVPRSFFYNFHLIFHVLKVNNC
jgi:hypothetical protein